MRIQLFLVCLLLLLGTALFAQSSLDTLKENMDIIFTKEEVKPSFIGGDEALGKYLTEKVNASTENEGEEGMVYFIVSAKGNIYDVKFLMGNISFERSLKKALLKSSGMWNSGLQNNHHVNAYCTLKVAFVNNTITAAVE
jgi:hypothetical protein